MRRNQLPPAHLLPLVTTVERVYSETPTWLVAVLLAAGLALLAAVSVHTQGESDREQCAATFGAGDARCSQ